MSADAKPDSVGPSDPESVDRVRFPAVFVSHGGGPWPWIADMKNMFAETAREFAELPTTLPAKPRAVLMITGHWEAAEFTVSTAQQPPMEYDYVGFPQHAYSIRYPGRGSPALAARVRKLLHAAGIASREDPQRGFDHGTFVPLSLLYPDGDVPVVMVSMKTSYDPAEHVRLGAALAPLRDEGVLIMGSGLTYHNMAGFGRHQSTAVAEAFESYLDAAISSPDVSTRNDMLVHWQDAPGARLAHPREDHLIPLMVVAGAAGRDTGDRLFVDHAMGVDMASYQFGASGRTSG